MAHSQTDMNKPPIIFTEGKTDWRHLSKAKEVLKFGHKISFYEKDDYSGDNDLLKICRSNAISPNDRINIFIFDRDNKSIIKNVTQGETDFKYWGNKVYSFALPVPEHRLGFDDNIAIEFYYSDNDLTITNRMGRRLFLTTEFNGKTGRHNKSPELSYGNRHKLKGCSEERLAKIIDSDVYNEKQESVALSKIEFAESVLKGEPPFDSINFKSFTKIFRVIEKIINHDESDSNKSTFIPIDYIQDESTSQDHPPVVKNFVGRKKYLEKLKSDDIRIIAITGLGGEGKSTLAAKFYEDIKDRQENDERIYLAWSDLKDMETPLHEKIQNIIENLTGGEQTKSKYAEENFNDTIIRFTTILNRKNCLVIFDNVDGFIDKDSSSFVGKLKLVFDQLTSRLERSQVIFTCRSALEDHHISFLEIPLTGLTYSDTKELAENFGIYPSKISENVLSNIYDETSGHALWLNLIFAQIRSERLNVKNISEILSIQSGFLDKHLLTSIWNTLSDNEKELIWIISTFTRPPSIINVDKASKSNYTKCRRILGSLSKLKLITEVDVNGTTHYDLHPIIKMKAQGECPSEKKRYFFKCVVAVLSFGDWRKLENLVNINDSYTPEIEGYVQCAEIAIEQMNNKQAINYIDHISEPLLKYGEDTKFIELCSELFKTIDTEKYQIGINRKISDIYSSFIDTLLQQGEFELVNKMLDNLLKSIKTINQFSYYTECQSHSLWFQNEFDKGLKFCNVAIDKIEDKGESVTEDLLDNFALINRDIGNVDEALDHFLTKIGYDKIEKWDISSDEDISSLVGNISRCLYLKGEYQKSLKLCKKCVKFIEKGQSRRMKVNFGYGLLWIADCYVKLNKFNDAKSYINNAILVWKKYCPSRINKIKNHITHYPVAFTKKYQFNFSLDN